MEIPLPGRPEPMIGFLPEVELLLLLASACVERPSKSDIDGPGVLCKEDRLKPADTGADAMGVVVNPERLEKSFDAAI